MEQQNDMKQKMMMIAAASIVIALIVIFAVVTISQRRMSKQETVGTMEGTEKSAETPVEEADPTGLMGLSTKGGKTQFARGDQITVFAYANSYGSPVTAYDVVIRYNPKQLSFNEVKSLQNGMDMLDTDLAMDDGKSNELIVTGVQSLSRQEPFVFDGTELAEITFTALESGTVNLALSFEKGSNRDSNLLDGSTNEILSNVEGVTLVIR